MSNEEVLKGLAKAVIEGDVEESATKKKTENLSPNHPLIKPPRMLTFFQNHKEPLEQVLEEN